MPPIPPTTPAMRGVFDADLDEDETLLGSLVEDDAAADDAKLDSGAENKDAEVTTDWVGARATPLLSDVP